MSTQKAGPKAGNSLKGFLAGSLIVGAVINPMHILFQIILVVGGILMLMDALVNYWKNVFPGTTTIMAIIGAIFSVTLTIYGYAYYYLALVIFIFIVLYLYYMVAKKGIYQKMQEKKNELKEQ